MDEIGKIWLMFAVVNAALANIDGRSPLAYFLGSLLLGPIPTIALAVTKYDPVEGTKFIDLIRGRSGKPAPTTKLPLWLALMITIAIGALIVSVS